MKKCFALLLILAMMLPCALAFADGAMTDKPINFAEFTFGDTFGNIRKNIKGRSIDFQYGAYISRYLADAIDSLPDYSNHNNDVAPCFKLNESGQRTVAGHRAGVHLWFAYSGNDLANENSAIFYAGEYEFDDNESNAYSTFTDIKGKMSQVYGAPYYEGSDISAALGEVTVDDMDRYNNDTAQNQAQYAVWKSSTNNTTVVLKYFNQYGDWERTFLVYLSDIADATLSQYIGTSGAAANNSLEGL